MQKNVDKKSASPKNDRGQRFEDGAPNRHRNNDDRRNRSNVRQELRRLAWG